MGLGLKFPSASLLRAVGSQTMQLYKGFELFSVDIFQPTLPTWKALKLTRYTQGIHKGQVKVSDKWIQNMKKFLERLPNGWLEIATPVL